MTTAFCFGPRNMCGSSSRGIVNEFCAPGILPGKKSLDPMARRESSSEPAPSIFFKISSNPPSFAKDFVVTGSLLSLCSVRTFVSCLKFLTADSRTRFCPTLSPNSSTSFGVRSFRASSLSRSSFFKSLYRSFFQLSGLAPRFKIKTCHFKLKENACNTRASR